MTLRINSTGPLALLQDKGRFGHQSVGVTPGGPMDEHAFDWANKLLGNDPNATQIEITLGQFSCTFYAATTMALTGADMQAKLNGDPIVPWQSYAINSGDKLEMGAASAGLRAYLSVSGGFKIDNILGSTATVVRDGLGGLEGNGKPLKANTLIRYSVDVSQLSTVFSEPRLRKQVPNRFIPTYGKHIKVGVIPSYQYDDFVPEERERFFSTVYTVSNNIDRMGYRLSGEAIQCQRNNLISEGIALGAIQIPNDGQPIVLMRDRQTIGGYPKIGCVIHADISRLSQCVPGSTVQFYEKELHSAEAELHIQRQFFTSYNS
ncbi:biotin-dependent carboxyltransferase family protein [Aliivibrio fischeri]|uniref:5-oxoprolinase subunit C family protein n=1 Tax=Aliivibrio fischeri TaxID=668 RepID=UPI0012DAAA5E|nr:biotin-dependent carboxyltransferase family protein [Aliivibrio fischeri]MUK66436.1 5-oxoprolinase/urea amidolyase family protein [Aliivibrio fischeri]